jgi:hypothetical protein
VWEYPEPHPFSKGFDVHIDIGGGFVGGEVLVFPLLRTGAVELASRSREAWRNTKGTKLIKPWQNLSGTEGWYDRRNAKNAEEIRRILVTPKAQSPTTGLIFRNIGLT